MDEGKLQPLLRLYVGNQTGQTDIIEKIFLDGTQFGHWSCGELLASNDFISIAGAMLLSATPYEPVWAAVSFSRPSMIEKAYKIIHVDLDAVHFYFSIIAWFSCFVFHFPVFGNVTDNFWSLTDRPSLVHGKFSPWATHTQEAPHVWIFLCSCNSCGSSF